jgi:hypothetical protein
MDSLIAYSDADHAADLSDRKSRTGAIVVLLGEPIHWITRKQTLVALATAAAELIASVDTIKIMLEIRVTLFEIYNRVRYTLQLGKLPKIKMRMDNTSAIAEISAGEFLNGANKHLAVRFYWVRQLWEEDELDLGYIASAENLGDLLTKIHGTVSLTRAITLCKMTNAEDMPRENVGSND